MDTGCCGMAGTFGFEAEHYELSMKVGELKLFPALRKLGILNRESSIGNPQSGIGNRESSIENRRSEIVSSGAACRMQIRQGTGAEAIHPIVLVWKSLKV